MCESAEGVRTMAARQCAGSIGAGAAPRPAGAAAPRPGVCGARNGPAATDSTVVKVTLGRLSDLRFSHGVCPETADRAPENAKAARVEMLRIILVIYKSLAWPLTWTRIGASVEAITSPRRSPWRGKKGALCS